MKQMLESRHYTSWQLVKLFWVSEERKAAYFLFAATVALTLLLVAFDVIFSYWFNYFYDALQGYKMRTSILLLGAFCALATINIIVAVYRYYLSQKLALNWRRWLTDQFVGRWLQRKDYYYLEVFDKQTDNPDQRIQEDVGGLVNTTLSLVLGFIGAITTFFSFIFVLWKLSGVITIPLGAWGTLHIPGYLVWVSVLYSLCGTYITFRVGYPLIGLNFEQQRREATFRFAAIDLRSHAENVALYRGENHQRSILDRLFGNVLDNWFAIILRQKKLLWFTSGYNQLAVILPLMVALPNYFNKVFQLGGLMQSIRAFNSLQEASSFFVNSYTTIAEWRAIAQRLTTFLNHLQDVDDRVNENNKLKFDEQPANKISTKGLSIATPQGERLLDGISEDFVHQNNYLIKGASGLGKSTFIRAIAGIWPYAAGEVSLPEKQKIMYLPQRPYMPIGTLAEAILFPDHEQPELEKQLEKVLRLCRLESFIPRLQEVAPWSEQLSPGEMQRIAFARVLLHKPDWVFMDESTSSLDIENEAYLYSLIKKQLPNCSIVSVGHRSTLDELHDHIIDMAKYSEQKTVAV